MKNTKPTKIDGFKVVENTFVNAKRISLTLTQYFAFRRQCHKQI